MKQLIAMDLVAGVITTGTVQSRMSPDGACMSVQGDLRPEAHVSPGRAAPAESMRIRHQPAPSASLLDMARSRQWGSSEVRHRRDSCIARHKRARRGRKALLQQTRKNVDIDCPVGEHVLLDGKTGIPLQLLSLNLGISGLKGSLQQLAASLRCNEDVAVLHLQEARLKSSHVPKWRKYVRAILPKYAMYVHCTSVGSHPTTSVVTLVRQELVKWISPMSMLSAQPVLSGCLLALRYAPPNVKQPIVFANIWMPHSGYKVPEIQEAHKAFGKLTAR